MVRIALISDIHYGQFSRTAEFSVPGEQIVDENVGGESIRESTIAILKEVNAQYLCIAGDLTSRGSPQEFSYCEQTIVSIAQEAGISQDRIILGLGNHDIDWKISKICDEYTAISDSNFPIELVKEKYRLIAANASLHYIDKIPKPNNNGPAPFSGVVENDDFVMFILNSGWCSTHDQTYYHGKLNVDQFGWFESSVKKYRTDTRWKIVLMHHHPFGYKYHVPNFDISMLEEGSNFLDVAGQNGIHLVLHGHRHHPNAETTFKNGWDHPITFVCAGSLTVNSVHRSNGDIPNTLHIIELTETTGILTLFSYQFSPAQGWIPFKSNCPETPLDAEMMFGKLFNSDEINGSILALAEVEKELVWKELDDCLRFLPVDNLNERIKTSLSDTHKMIGHFPGEVILIKK